MSGDITYVLVIATHGHSTSMELGKINGWYYHTTSLNCLINTFDILYLLAQEKKGGNWMDGWLLTVWKCFSLPGEWVSHPPHFSFVHWSILTADWVGAVAPFGILNNLFELLCWIHREINPMKHIVRVSNTPLGPLL